jgi:hypothetical protein
MLTRSGGGRTLSRDTPARVKAGKPEEDSMFAFIIEVAAVSVLVSLGARWAEIVPHYKKLRYAILMQSLNAGLLTIVLTVLITMEIYPSWILLFVLILSILWLSVQLTAHLAHHRRGDAAPK